MLVIVWCLVFDILMKKSKMYKIVLQKFHCFSLFVSHATPLSSFLYL